MYYKKLGNVTPQPTKHPLSQPLHRIDVWVLPNPLTHLRIICWIPILMADRISFIFPTLSNPVFFNLQQPEMPRFFGNGYAISVTTNIHQISFVPQPFTACFTKVQDRKESSDWRQWDSGLYLPPLKIATANPGAKHTHRMWVANCREL